MALGYPTIMAKLHRYVMGFPDSLVDHKSRDRQDCRRENLRECTYGESIRNTGKRELVCSSKYKGVCFSRERWVARIQHEGKKMHIGTYLTEREAALAYDRAAMKYFGEFARLNFRYKKQKELMKEPDRKVEI